MHGQPTNPITDADNTSVYWILSTVTVVQRSRNTL